MSTFFDLARRGKRVTAIWFAIPLSIVIFLFGAMPALSLLYHDSINAKIFNAAPDGHTGPWDEAALTSPEVGIFLIASFLGVSILSWLWFRLFEGRGFASFGPGLGASLFQFGRGFGFALLIMAIMSYTLHALGYVEISQEPGFPAGWVTIWPLAVLVLGWIIQGSTEEIVTRGLLFQSVGARNGLIWGMVASAGMFTLLHGMNPNTSALFFANLAFFSLFACFYCLREGSLWGICGYHAGWNFALGNVFGFAVSGQEIGVDRVMAFRDTGPEIITGGATGLEGGLVTTASVLVSAVLLMLIKPARSHETANEDTGRD